MIYKTIYTSAPVYNTGHIKEQPNEPSRRNTAKPTQDIDCFKVKGCMKLPPKSQPPVGKNINCGSENEELIPLSSNILRLKWG